MLALCLWKRASNASASAVQQHCFRTRLCARLGFEVLAFKYSVEGNIVDCRVFGAEVMTLREFLQRRAAGQSMPALDFRALALRLLQVSPLLDVG